MSALFLRTLLVVVITLLPALASAQGLRVLARVNDDAITDFDLQQRVLFAIRTTGLQDSPDLRQRMSAQMLRQMIDERLQIQDAKRLGLKATDNEMQQRFSDIKHPDAVTNLLHEAMEAKSLRHSGGGVVRAPDVVDQIERLEGLLQRGSISQEEFDAQKSKLLGG